MATAADVFAGRSVFVARSLAAPQRIKDLQIAVANNGGRVVNAPASADVVVVPAHADQRANSYVELPNAATDEWVTHSVRANEALDPRFFSPHHDNIFSGVFAVVSRVADDMRHGLVCAAVQERGGHVVDLRSVDLPRSTTHVITEELAAAQDKVKTMSAAAQIHIVTPQWVFESMRSRHRQPEERYFPERTAEQPQSDTFAGCVFFVSHANLALLSDAIAHHGGVLVNARNAAVTHIVTERTTDDDMRFGATMVRAAWVWDCIREQRRVPILQPVCYLPEASHTPLEFPLTLLPREAASVHPKTGKRWIVCITNYLGNERDQVKRLIVGVGARVSVELHQHDTNVLVCNHEDKGDKAKAAKSWNIPCVNHLWLVDTLVQGSVPDLADSRYNTDHCLQVPPLTSCLAFVAHEFLKGRVVDISARPPLPNAGSSFRKRTRPEAFDTDAADSKRLKKSDAWSLPAASPARSPRKSKIYITSSGLTNEQTKLLETLAARHPLYGYDPDAEKASIVVADKLKRSLKVLRAICNGAQFVTTAWSRAALAHASDGTAEPVERFVLVDKETEKQFGFSLQESLRRASTRSAPLFSDIVVACGNGDEKSKTSQKAIAAMELVKEGGGVLWSYKDAIKHSKTKPLHVIVRPDEGSSSAPAQMDALIESLKPNVPPVIDLDQFLNDVFRQSLSFLPKPNK